MLCCSDDRTSNVFADVQTNTLGLISCDHHKPSHTCARLHLQVPQLTEEELEAKRKQRAKDRARTLAIANEQLAPDPEVCMPDHLLVCRRGVEQCSPSAAGFLLFPFFLLLCLFAESHGPCDAPSPPQGRTCACVHACVLCIGGTLEVCVSAMLVLMVGTHHG